MEETATQAIDLLIQMVETTIQATQPPSDQLEIPEQ
jgi:hypothetical protein